MDIFPSLETKLGPWNLDQKSQGIQKPLFSSFVPQRSDATLSSLNSPTPTLFLLFFTSHFLLSFNNFTPTLHMIFWVTVGYRSRYPE